MTTYPLQHLFNEDPRIEETARRLYTSELGEYVSQHDERCYVRLEDFAFYVGLIMSNPVPATFAVDCGPLYTATVSIRSTSKVAAEVWINDVSCGSRAQAVRVYTAMARPYIRTKAPTAACYLGFADFVAAAAKAAIAGLAEPPQGDYPVSTEIPGLDK